MRKSYLPAAKRKAAAISTAGGYLNDEQAANVPSIFMPWDATAVYAKDQRVKYGDYLYKCLTAHTAQATWKPDASPSLWVRVDNPAEEWPLWRQPAGGHDAYAQDAKVTHKGKRWKSNVGNNVWEPGVYGWTEAA